MFMINRNTMERALYTFIHLLFRIIKLTRSQSFRARSFYDTSQLVNKNRTRALSMK